MSEPALEITADMAMEDQVAAFLQLLTALMEDGHPQGKAVRLQKYAQATVSTRAMKAAIMLVTSSSNDAVISHLMHTIVEYFSVHPLVMCRIFNNICKQLAKCRRYDMLLSISESLVPKLLQLMTMKQQDLKVVHWALFSFRQLIMGYQHSPKLFFAHLPGMMTVLSALEQAAGPEQDEIRVAQILQSLLFLFNCYPNITDVVTQRLTQYEVLSKQTIIDFLSRFRWFVEDNTLKKWVEGEWFCKEADGYLRWMMGKSLIGRRTVGAYTGGPRKTTTSPIRERIGQVAYWHYSDTRYVEGTILHTRQNQVFFKGSYGVHWCHEMELFYSLPVPQDVLQLMGLQAFAYRANDDKFIARGVITDVKQGEDPDKDPEEEAEEVALVWLAGIRFDNGDVEYVPVDNVRLFHTPRMNFFSQHQYGGGNVEGTLHIDEHKSSNVRMAGRFKETNNYFPGRYDVEFSADGESFQGRYMLSGKHNGCWLGVRTQVTEHTTFATQNVDWSPAAEGKETHAKGILLDGRGDFIYLGSQPHLDVNGTQPFTVEACIYIESKPSKGSQAVIMSRFDSNGKGSFIFAVNDKMKLSFLFIEATEEVPLQTWTHVAFSFDGVRGTLFMNGVPIGAGKLMPFEEAPGVPTLLGAQLKNRRAIGFLNAKLREVRMWNTSKPAEHFQLNAFVSIPSASFGLVGYWPLVSLFGFLEDRSPFRQHAMLGHRSNMALDRLQGRCDSKGNSAWEDVQQHVVTGHVHSRWTVGDKQEDFFCAGSPSLFASAPLTAQGGLTAPRAIIDTADQTDGKAATTFVLDGALTARNKLQNLTQGFKTSVRFTLDELQTPGARAEIAVQFQAAPLWQIDPAVMKYEHRLRHHPQSFQSITDQVTVHCAFVALDLTSVGIEITIQATGPSFGEQSAQVGGAYKCVLPLNYLTQLDAIDIVYVPAAKTDSTTGLHPLEQKTTTGPGLTVSVGGFAQVKADVAVVQFFGSESVTDGCFTTVYAQVVSTAESGLPVLSVTHFDLKTLAPLTSQQKFLSSVAFQEQENLRNVVTQLRELEHWIKPGNQWSEWKRQRGRWADSLASIDTFEALVVAVHKFCASVCMDPDVWSKEAYSTWLKVLQLSVNVAQLCKGLLVVIDKAGKKAFYPPWQGRVKKKIDQLWMLTTSLTRIKDHSEALQRLTEAKNLRHDIGMEVDLSTYVEALKVNDDNREQAGGWLLEREEALKQQFYFREFVRLNHLVSAGTDNAEIASAIAPLVVSHESHLKKTFLASSKSYNQHRDLTKQAKPFRTTDVKHSACSAVIADVADIWDTSRGRLSLEDAGLFVGKHGFCQYPHGNGTCDGMFSQDLTYDGWVFEGTWAEDGYTEAYPCRFEFTTEGNRFSGWWSNEDSRGEWIGLKSSGFYQRQNTGFSGLVNLGNTCYQNSFLQALFNTGAIRRSLLQAALPLLEEPAKEGKEQDDQGPTRPDQILRRMQELFAMLNMSQRPSVNQDMLKNCLKEPFHKNKQQDSDQYGKYLVELLEEGLKGTDASNLCQNVFGGSQKTAVLCHECGHCRSLQEEPLTGLMVSFPEDFKPITGLGVIYGSTSKLDCNPDFERINTNTNAGRKDSEYCYVCVSREQPELDPITEIRVVCAEEGEQIGPWAEWEVIPGNLNYGGEGQGAQVHMCVRRERNGSPITQITLLSSSDENVSAPEGFEKIPIDLNSDSGGSYVFLCVQRGGVVRDVQLCFGEDYESVLHNKPPGLSIVPTNINLLSARPSKTQQERDNRTALRRAGQPCGDEVFLAFTCGGTKSAVTNISCMRADVPDAKGAPEHDPETTYDHFFHIGTTLMKLRVERGQGSPAQGIEVYRAPKAAPKYGGHSVVKLTPDLPVFEGGIENLHKRSWHLDNNQWLNFNKIELDRGFECFIVEGGYSKHKGNLYGVVFKVSDAYPTAEDRERFGDKYDNYMFEGSWKQANYHYRQPCQFYFSEDFESFSGVWQHGDGEGNWSGVKMQPGQDRKDNAKSKNFKAILDSGPITDILVLGAEEDAPDGYVKVTESPEGNSASLNAGGEGDVIHFAVERNPDKKAVSDVIVLMEGIDVLPEGYEYILCADGQVANANAGSAGHVLRLAVQHSKTVLKTQWDKTKLVYDVGVMWLGVEQSPVGYRPVQATPLGIPADLNGRPDDAEHTEIMLILFKAKPRKPASKDAVPKHPLESQWQTNSGVWTSVVVAKVTGYNCSSSFDDSGWARGIIYPNAMLDKKKKQGGGGGQDKKKKPEVKINGHRMLGRYNPGDFKLPGYISYVFNDNADALQCRYGIKGNGDSATGRKDIDVVLTFERSSRSLWKDGEEIVNVVGTGNSISDMVRSHFQPELMVGGNRVMCPGCNKKAVVGRYPCLKTAPSHLILSTKRFKFDYRSLQTSKVMNTIGLDVAIELPLPETEMKAEVFEDEGAYNQLVQDGLHYGLYAVLVHSGSHLNSGHYFVYARDSDCDVLQEDCEDASWMCFNDTVISKIDWEDIVDTTRRSVSDSAYILFYRRVVNTGDETTTEDGKEQKSSSEIKATAYAPDAVQQVVDDNVRFVKEMKGHTTFNYLMHLNAKIRQSTGFVQHVKLPECEVEQMQERPIRLAKEFRDFVVSQCKDCGAQLLRGDKETHYVHEDGDEEDPVCKIMLAAMKKPVTRQVTAYDCEACGMQITTGFDDFLRHFNECPSQN